MNARRILQGIFLSVITLVPVVLLVAASIAIFGAFLGAFPNDNSVVPVMGFTVVSCVMFFKGKLLPLWKDYLN